CEHRDSSFWIAFLFLAYFHQNGIRQLASDYCLQEEIVDLVAHLVQLTHDCENRVRISVKAVAFYWLERLQLQMQDTTECTEIAVAMH
ncbi:unnamed protein product, partial [Toxocara canis]|uniref:BACK domain-containing protein n=1 Tax=Toxocara canis TaxID=6265 RepID=A0A183U386_TOXCA